MFEGTFSDVVAHMYTLDISSHRFLGEGREIPKPRSTQQSIRERFFFFFFFFSNYFASSKRFYLFFFYFIFFFFNFLFINFF